MSEPKVVVMGVCASGKTTLVAGLAEAGICAWNVPQEHSFVRRLWEKQHPTANVIVLLDASFETTVRRRPTIAYGPGLLDEQRRRLTPAREACHLFLPTDGLNIDQVRQTVLDWLQAWKERSQ